MEMNIELNSNLKKQCSFCSDDLCHSNTVIINEEILELLKLIIKGIDLHILLNLLICGGCLKQINNARNFIISIQNSQRSIIDVKVEEGTCDNSFVTCYVCKAAVTKESSGPLFNSPYIQDMVSDSLKEVFENAHNLEVCESCQSSMMNFHNILNLILVHCLINTNNDSSEIQNQEQIEIKQEPLPENFNSHESMIQSVFVKNEADLDTNEEDISIHDDVQIKLEEVYVKMEPISDEKMEFTEQDSNTLDQMLDCQPGYKKDKNFKDINCTKTSKSHHQDINEIETFKCHLCKFQTKHTYSLKRHMLTHDGNNKLMFKCHLCMHQTNKRSSLKIHMLIHAEINERETFKCYSCKFQTKHKEELKNHMLIHKSVNEIETFKCHLCKFQTNHKPNLESHMLLHKIKKIKIFKCNLCNYQAKRARSLKNHMLIHEGVTKIETFKCHLCQFETNRKSSLPKHMLIHNATSESIKCHLCAYQTNRKASLNRHMLIHKTIDEVKAFKCNLCQFATKHNASLRKHLLNHSVKKEIKEIEIFKCHLCDYQVNRKQTLDSHLSIHEALLKVDKLYR